MVKNIFLLFILLFVLACSSNQEIDLGNTVDFETANREMRELILPFLKSDWIDPFSLGIVDLEENPEKNNCKRKYHFDRSDFNRCKLIVVSLLLLSQNDKMDPGLVAIDSYSRLCNIRKVYFLHNGSYEGEVNFCSILNIRI